MSSHDNSALIKRILVFIKHIFAVLGLIGVITVCGLITAVCALIPSYYIFFSGESSPFARSTKPTFVPECKFDNLIHPSIVHIPVFVKGESNVETTLFPNPRKLGVRFQNQRNGSGIAFQLDSKPNIGGCKYLELTGTTTRSFTFRIEYKVGSGNNLTIVNKSRPTVFAVTPQANIETVPITFAGAIDEVVINFLQIGESSEFTIESVQLK